jgi:hypothetical protein
MGLAASLIDTTHTVSELRVLVTILERKYHVLNHVL